MFSHVIDTDKAYVSFHDECWGVPVYNDKYVICVTFPLSYISISRFVCLPWRKITVQSTFRASRVVWDADGLQLDWNSEKKGTIQVKYSLVKLLTRCVLKINVNHIINIYTSFGRASSNYVGNRIGRLAHLWLIIGKLLLDLRQVV